MFSIKINLVSIFRHYQKEPSKISKGLSCSVCSQHEPGQCFLKKIQMDVKVKSLLLSKKGQQQLRQLTHEIVHFYLFQNLNIFLVETLWWLFFFLILFFFFQKCMVTLSIFQKQNSKRRDIISSKALNVKLEKRKKGERKVEKQFLKYKNTFALKY